ncbi:MAG: TRAP transporter substrate-binding protein [Gammaproteobacteria bacterium]|nr:TRAP transporter substrate-binding protein [Gammaproteobacteria bacterium]
MNVRLPRICEKLAIATILFCALSVSANTEQITLRLHTFNSPNAIVVRDFLIPWAAQIKDISQDRVTVQIFPAMQLGGRPADLYGQARDGVVDIIWTVQGYTPGRFPLTEVFELPFVCGDAEATSVAMMQFYEDWMLDEYSDTHPLVFHAAAPAHLHTVAQKVTSLNDLKGMKVRTSSQISAEMLESLGAMPVGMPVPQTYEALARGVVDAAWLPWTIMRPFRLHEVTKYHTEAGLCCTPFVLTMNKKRYDELPSEIQQILNRTTGIELAKRLGRIWQADELIGREIAETRGHEILSLSYSERARWEDATATVIQRWITKVTAMGFDGEKLLEDARALVANYSDG